MSQIHRFFAGVTRWAPGEGGLALESEPLAEGGVVALGPEETKHAARVLRLRAGSAVTLFNGAGAWGEGILEDPRAGRVRLDRTYTEPPSAPRLRLAFAIPKGKRLQALVEKAVELGVDQLQPLCCARSVVESGGQPTKWLRWIVEACKQSRRAWLPRIAPPVDAAALDAEEDALGLLAHPGGTPLLAELARARPAAVTIAIGPEGGWTEAEVESFAERGFAPIALGPHILRIETAVAAACALVRGGGALNAPP